MLFYVDRSSSHPPFLFVTIIVLHSTRYLLDTVTHMSYGHGFILKAAQREGIIMHYEDFFFFFHFG